MLEQYSFFNNKKKNDTDNFKVNENGKKQKVIFFPQWDTFPSLKENSRENNQVR